MFRMVVNVINRNSNSFTKERQVVSALDELLDLSGEEKLKRGLVYTPAEIAQQPATWESTYSLFRKRRTELAEFLAVAGFADNTSAKTCRFSDWRWYLRLCWQKSRSPPAPKMEV